MKPEFFGKTHFEIMDDAFSSVTETLDPKNEIGQHFYNFIDWVAKETGDTFIAFRYDMQVLSFIKFLHDTVYRTDMTDDETRTALYETLLPYLFYKSGRKVFRFKDDLIHLLLSTDLSSVDSFFLRTPFKCVYLAIPSTITLLNPNGTRIDGIYVSIMEGEDINVKNLSNGFHEKTQNRYLNCKEPKNLIIMSVSNLSFEEALVKNAIYYWNILFIEGDILPQVEEALNRYDVELNKKSDYNRVFLERLFAFVMNAMLYINSYEKRMELIAPKHINVKSKKKQNKLERKSKLPYYYMGNNITINPIYKNIIDLTVKDENYKIRGKYSGRWMVRGHMKTQHYGKQWAESKIIWIQPFEKGSGNEITNKDYTVE